MTKFNNFKSVIYLSLTAFIWGIAFVFQSSGNNYMQPMTFTSCRNLLGALVVLPIVIIKFYKPRFLADDGEISVKDSPKKKTLINGSLCGLALSTATVMQQYGLKQTTVGKAGFITTLYIILVPIFGLFIGKKCHFTVWIGAAVSVVGMYFLTMTESFTLSLGDILVFLCAILFAIQIMIIDSFGSKTNGVLFSFVEFLTAGILCGIGALIFDHPTFSQIYEGLIPILYTGIMSSGVAYTLQILGQRNFNPTIAAMIMSFESVVCAVSGYLAYAWGFVSQDQSLTALQIIGCVIMFAAVIFVQLPFDKMIKRRH